MSLLYRINDLTSLKLDVLGPERPSRSEAAAKAGIRTIGMLCGGFPEQSLRAAGCIAIYRDPAHLLAEYKASPLGAGGMLD
jgi:hypothetical protein